MVATKEKISASREYMIGIVHGGPASCVHLAGIDFPEHTEDVSTPEGSYKTERIRHSGRTAVLTDVQVKGIVKALENRIVRWAGNEKTRRATIYLKSYRGYRAMPNDVPLGKYVYMTPVDELDTMSILQGATPKPLLD